MDYNCSICKKGISERVYQYSIKHYKKALCFEHQKTVKSTSQYYCNECKKTISYAEFQFSLKNFNRALCRDCQPVIEKNFSAPSPKFHGTYKIEIGGKLPKEATKNDNYF